MKNIIKKVYSGVLIALVFGFLSLPTSLLVAQSLSQNNLISNELPVDLIVELINPISETKVRVGDLLGLSAKINKPATEISSANFNFFKLGEAASINVPAHFSSNSSLTESALTAENIFKDGEGGEYNLTLDVTLTDGTLHKSDAVSFTVENLTTNIKPLVQILTPADGEIFNRGSSLMLTSVIDKNVGDITSFDFLINNKDGINIFSAKGAGGDDSVGFSKWTGSLDLSDYDGDYTLDAKVGYNNQFYNLASPVHFTVQDPELSLPKIEASIDYSYKSDSSQSELKEVRANINRTASTITDFYFSVNRNDLFYKKISVEKPSFSDLYASDWVWSVDSATPLPEGNYIIAPSFIYSGDGQRHIGNPVSFVIKRDEPTPSSEPTLDPIPTPTTGEEKPLLTNLNDNSLPSDFGQEGLENVSDANNSLPQTSIKESNRGEIVIIDSASIKFIDKDFILKAKTNNNIARVSYTFENLDNDKMFIFPALKSQEDGYWSAAIDAHDKVISGKYRVFAKGFLIDGSFVKTADIFIEILPLDNKNDVFIEGNNLPLSCTENGYKTPELCNRYLALDPLCREKGLGINDKEKCKRLLFVETLPLVCREIRAESENDCMEKLEITNECFAKGIFSKGACSNYKSSSTSATVKDEKIKEVAVSEKTDEGGSLKEWPIKIENTCVYYGINSIKECAEFLRVKEISEECVSSGIKKVEDCDKYLNNKYISPECQEKGLIRDKECREYIFKEYAPFVACEEIDEWQCKNTIKEKYLNEIIVTEKLIRNIESKVVQKINTINEAGDLTAGLGITSDNKGVSFKDEKTAIRVIKAKKDSVLTREKNLIQTLPIAVVIDSDKDGLSDDMELELGTEPNNSDTDQDGYMDGEEIINGYSPLVSSADVTDARVEIESVQMLLEKISPLNRAIIAGNSIEQPKASGKESPQVSIESVKNNENEEDGYNISGKGIPSEYISLYIYSDLPVVVTTKVDENGNWTYNLKKSLTDGEHEVYVVINDNTGKIVSKSSPLNFFIKEAKAVSIEEAVGIFTDDGEATEESKLISVYFLFVGGVVFVGILTFIVFLNQRKKENDLN